MFSHKIFGASIILIVLAVAAASVVEQNGVTVDFRETLDASKLNKKNYENFLTRLRTKLKDKLPGASVIGGTVVLPFQTEPRPLRWFHLRIDGEGGKHTTIRFRGDNLYFVGYLMQDSVNWIELGRRGDTHYIAKKDTTFTGFRGDYNDLKNNAGLDSLEQVSLTKLSLNDAVATLAESTDRRKRARAVIVVVQMVSEACRFLQIGEHLATNILNANNVLRSWMVPLETNWESYSTMVLLAHNFPECKAYKPQTINGEVLKTADDLRKKHGVILRSRKSEVNPCRNYGEDDDDELRPNVVNFQARKDYVEPADVQAA